MPEDQLMQRIVYTFVRGQEVQGVLVAVFDVVAEHQAHFDSGRHVGQHRPVRHRVALDIVGLLRAQVAVDPVAGVHRRISRPIPDLVQVGRRLGKHNPVLRVRASGKSQNDCSAPGQHRCKRNPPRVLLTPVTPRNHNSFLAKLANWRSRQS